MRREPRAPGRRGVGPRHPRGLVLTAPVGPRAKRPLAWALGAARVNREIWRLHGDAHHRDRRAGRPLGAMALIPQAPGDLGLTGWQDRATPAT